MSKKNTLRPAESLNPFETHASEKLVRADRICLLVLTLLYGLIALLNLGTLNFPESVYYGDTGDTFTLTFDAPRHPGRSLVQREHCHRFFDLYQRRRGELDLHPGSGGYVQVA